MRSLPWIIGWALHVITRTLIRQRQRDIRERERDREERSNVKTEGGVDVTTRQEMLAATRKQKRQGTDSPPGLSEEVQPCHHLDFRLLVY